MGRQTELLEVIKAHGPINSPTIMSITGMLSGSLHRKLRRLFESGFIGRQMSYSEYLKREIYEYFYIGD